MSKSALGPTEPTIQLVVAILSRAQSRTNDKMNTLLHLLKRLGMSTATPNFPSILAWHDLTLKKIKTLSVGFRPHFFRMLGWYTNHYITRGSYRWLIYLDCWLGVVIVDIPTSTITTPQSAYAQHILRYQHEYGTIMDTMTLLKPVHKTSVLIPYEQLFMQTFHHNGSLITEQSRGEQNPLFQLAIDTGLTAQLFHNRSVPPVWYTWISSNSTRADGSRPGYVKTIFIWSQWCYSRSILTLYTPS